RRCARFRGVAAACTRIMPKSEIATRIWPRQGAARENCCLSGALQWRQLTARIEGWNQIDRIADEVERCLEVGGIGGAAHGRRRVWPACPRAVDQPVPCRVEMRLPPRDSGAL